jgi:hypothetical protein
VPVIIASLNTKSDFYSDLPSLNASASPRTLISLDWSDRTSLVLSCKDAWVTWSCFRSWALPMKKVSAALDTFSIAWASPSALSIALPVALSFENRFLPVSPRLPVWHSACHPQPQGSVSGDRLPPQGWLLSFHAPPSSAYSLHLKYHGAARFP